MSNASIILFLLLLLLQATAFCSSVRLATNSRWIVDKMTGRRVKLTCANWVSHLQPMVAEGVEKQPVGDIAGRLVATGFNCVRFTWATFMFTRSNFSSITVAQSLDRFGLADAKAGIGKNNPRFLNMTVVEVHQAMVEELGRNGVMVVLDNHVSQPNWCCGGDDGNGFFGDANFDPNEWLQGLTAVARTYKGSSAVVAMSMRNELRGNRQNQDDWYKYMQQGAEAIHKENPDILVIVSGLSYDSDLGFLKANPFGVDLKNKLVFEAHWYAFGQPADQWAAQTNQLCAKTTTGAENNYLFLTTGNNSFPVFISEFGINQSGENEADNRYIGCLLAKIAEMDIDWALWTFQGSYILREGKVNFEEFYGVMNFNWNGTRNSSFLDRLQLVRQINQVPNSNKRTVYILFHPLTGQCAQVSNTGGAVILGSCKNAIQWEQHQESGLIKLAAGGGSGQCLGAVGVGGAAHVSNQCSGNGTMWKSVSASGLHLASQTTQGGYLCLERNASNSAVITNKCLCVGDDLADLPSCGDNPQVQWFKLVPTNV